MAKGKKTGGRDFQKGGYQPAVRGKPGVPADLRKASDLTKANLRGLLNKYLWMSKVEIQSKMRDHNVPMIEMVIASIIFKAAHQGDEKRLTFILDRMIGKVKEEIDINTYYDRLRKMSDSEVIQLGKQAITYLQASND